MDFENKNEERRDWREERKNYAHERWGDRYHSGNGGIWTGVLLLLIGADYFLVENKVIPDWMWSWNMLLIALGLFIGFRHNFRGPTWFILIVVGSVFLIKSDE